MSAASIRVRVPGVGFETTQQINKVVVADTGALFLHGASGRPVKVYSRIGWLSFEEI